MQWTVFALAMDQATQCDMLLLLLLYVCVLHLCKGLTSVAISSLHYQLQHAALGKPGLLDLPSCSSFKQAGPIQYCDLNLGTGDSPLAGDLIIVDYTARAVATGEVYDGSRNFKFTVGNGEVSCLWILLRGWSVAKAGSGLVHYSWSSCIKGR
jgi:hypothetical protein